MSSSQWALLSDLAGVVALIGGIVLSKATWRAARISRALPDDATAPSPALDELLRDPRTAALANLGPLMVAAILALMVWKPGG